MSMYNLIPFVIQWGTLITYWTDSPGIRKLPVSAQLLLALSSWLQNGCGSRRDHIPTCQSTVLAGLSLLVPLWVKESSPHGLWKVFPSHIIGQIIPNAHIYPCPVWLSWLGIIPQGERLPIRFLVRAHALVAGLVPSLGTYERQPIDISLSHRCFSPSLSLSFALSLKINK